ncbi:MAG: hypothetical protein PHU06_01300 [Gallionella sp.]|nr:hypothetical protein [Gallionella sp.]
MLKLYALVFCVLLQMGVAHADNSAVKKDVEVTLKQFKVGKHAESEVLESATQIKPGEVIEYQATYHNTTKHAISQLLATLPIPKETEYIPNTANPVGVEASLDGVTYAPVPLRRMVKLANGQMTEQAVPLIEYRSLRWVLGDLSAGQKKTVSARIRLSPLTSAVAGGAKK